MNISSKIYYIVFTKLFIIFSGVGDTQHHCQIPDGFLRKIIQILTILITDSHTWSCSLANSWIMILRLHPKTVRVLYVISTFKRFLKEKVILDQDFSFLVLETSCYLINNPKMFNGVTDDLAAKPYIP